MRLGNLLDEADQLVEERRFVEAVDLLAAANREAPDPDLEVRLIDLRHEAAKTYDAGAGRSPWPPIYADPFPDVAGVLPEIRASDLSANVLGGAVAHHGALIVRGAFRPEQVARSVDAIHRTQTQRDLDATDAWFRPFPLEPGIDRNLREIVRGQGGTWLADSPRSTALILDELQAAGVTDAISEHLGERLLFSLQKSTLRRSVARNKLVAWHQDGSFLDPHVRTMNVWVALSKCGGDYPSPGLQVAPMRIPEILEVDGALTPHSISAKLVAEVTAEVPVIVPEFDPGDAMLFDERFLHRTYLNAEMTEDRYALECWFFAPSHPSSDYISFLV
jgi:hypothetical protein